MNLIRGLLGVATALPLVLAGSVASAAVCGIVDGVRISVSLHSSNSGISSFTCSYTGTGTNNDVLTINETWTSTGAGVVSIVAEEGFIRSGSFVVTALSARGGISIVKNLTNNSGSAWTRLANELLDPAGNGNDSLDPVPQPAFVPAGYSTSNDNDGLSFNQGGSIPRTSPQFSQLLVDELSDVRDFLDFFGGTIANGAVGQVNYGLNIGDTDNLPALLVQRPNVSSRPDPVPAPATLAVFGASLLGLAGLRRRKA